MPDPLALTMDIIDTKGGPALSATSDAPQVEQQPEPSVDEPVKPDNTDGTSGETEGEADGQPPKEAGEGKDDTPAPVKAVISREKNRRQAAEQRAAQLETQLSQAIEALNKLTTQQSQAQAADPRPTRDTFSDPDAYDRAVAEWGVREGERRGREAAQAEIAKQQQEDRAKTILKSYEDRAKTFAEDHPDFEDAVFDPSLPLTPAMSQAIVINEEGPAIAYHLAQNPEVAQRIAQLDPVSQVFEIGRIAARLSQPAPTPKPEPVRPLGARQSNVVSPDQESMDQYGARRLAELRGQRH